MMFIPDIEGALNYKVEKKLEKPRPTLIPPEALQKASEILTFGANKYVENGWVDLDTTIFKDALFRHLLEYLKDENSVDSESGEKHIHHLLANALILSAKSEKEG